MEKQITVKKEINSLDSLLNQLKTDATFQSSKEYDIWDSRTDSNGQMEQCIVVKKGAMHGMKIYFSKENAITMTYIIPNKLMNTYFGKSQKRYRSVIQILTGSISQALLSGSQKKAFAEIEQVVGKLVA